MQTANRAQSAGCGPREKNPTGSPHESAGHRAADHPHHQPNAAIPVSPHHEPGKKKLRDAQPGEADRYPGRAKKRERTLRRIQPPQPCGEARPKERRKRARPREEPEPSGEKQVRDHRGASAAQRKPIAWLYVSGAVSQRQAGFAQSLFGAVKSPPRSTRSVPVAGPCGSTVVSLPVG